MVDQDVNDSFLIILLTYYKCQNFQWAITPKNNLIIFFHSGFDIEFFKRYLAYKFSKQNYSKGKNSEKMPEAHGHNPHLNIQLWLNRYMGLSFALAANQNKSFGQNSHS